MSRIGTKGFWSSRAKRSLITRVIKEIFMEAREDQKGITGGSNGVGRQKETAT